MKKLLFLALSIVGIGITFSTTSSALSGSDFSAGHIIDDGVFFNNYSMTVDQIQAFLNSQVTICDINHAGFTGSSGTSYNPPWTCLKDFYENPDSSYSLSYTCLDENGNSKTNSIAYYYNNAYQYTSIKPVFIDGTTNCYAKTDTTRIYNSNIDHLTATINSLGGVKPSGSISAAQIIWNAAQAYGINPQVLIVLLQKEEGLITDTWPAPWQYQSATGYGCSDTSPCKNYYSGFSKQIYSAAWQFRNYTANPDGFNFKGGATRNISYSPSSSCGSSSVYIQNQSTANLYNYTPYQPNAAALATMTDTSPSSTVTCGAYGNQNFFWYFTKWFDSTYSPDYSWALSSQLLYSDSTKTTAISANNLTPGQKIYAVIKVRNTGKRTWLNSGATPIRLGTSNPYQRISQFCDASWLSCNRPATLTESSVAPGNTGTFEFYMTAPTTVGGTFTEYFTPLIEDVTWMRNIGMFYQITVQQPILSWQMTNQYAYTDAPKTTTLDINNIKPGQQFYVGFTAKNTGNVTWSNSGANPIMVGTLSPYERQSLFSTGSNWVSATRPAGMKETNVAPGQTATFEFYMTAPTSTGGIFNERFGLLSEGIKWLNDVGLSFYANVSTPIFSWQMTSQYAYTDNTKTTLANMGSLLPGQKVYVGFTAKNTGNMTWSNNGLNPVMVGTISPYERQSTFSNGSSWTSPTRPALMKETSVAPGQTATFEFYMTVPQFALGVYNERFGLLADKASWMNDVGLSYYMNVVQPTLSWQMTSQYAYTDATKTTPFNMANMTLGQKAYVGFTAKNTGNVTWSNSGANPIMVGTSSPYERQSLFSLGSNWVSATRPAGMKETNVAPGQTATFEFYMTAPNQTGIYNERFGLLSENLSWLNDVGLSYYVKTQ